MGRLQHGCPFWHLITSSVKTVMTNWRCIHKLTPQDYHHSKLKTTEHVDSRDHLLQQIPNLVRILGLKDVPEGTRFTFLDQHAIFRLLTATSHIHRLQRTYYTRRYTRRYTHTITITVINREKQTNQRVNSTWFNLVFITLISDVTKNKINIKNLDLKNIIFC